MVINDNSVSGSEILSLIKNDETLNDSSVGNIIYSDIKEIYISEILKNIDTDISELKVVIDSGNGAAGFIAPELFKRLGCDVIELYSEVDGNFPNHHPDPGKLENLEDIISEVKNKSADIGFAFDGDGDRVGLITNLGDMIFPDKQMMLFSEDILKNKKGPIVFDVKCSNHLSNLIFKNGGTPIMAPTGHFHIKKAIKKNNALLGGEMSGHIFFNDKWYGFDDGPYAAVRAAEILAKSNRSISEIFREFPESFSTPELNITVTDENKFEIIDRFMANSDIDGDKILIDGLRVNCNDGWGLLRASNTTPKLVLRFEGDTEESMNRIQNEFISELSRICPEIDINLD
jgi:phosphomannomutase/phosphoglucomutase